MSLRSLSDSEILSCLQDLVRREREVTLLVLLHLNELERRKLHLKLGYSSLFDYCTSGLGYSVSAAARRIRTARCVARFPGIYELLERNELNLSTVAQVSGALTPDNHEHLIDRIRGKSQREVEAILAEYSPSDTPRDRIRTVVVRVPLSSRDSARSMFDTAPVTCDSRDVTSAPLADEVASPTDSSGACENSAYFRNGSGSSGQVAVVPSVSNTDHVQKRVAIQFSVRPEFMTKLNRIKGLLWHRLPANATLEHVFDFAMDIILEKEDHGIRVERRKQRVQRANQRSQPKAQTSPANPGRRHIPLGVRDEIFARDGGQCTFVGSDGRRCNAAHALQVDHIEPVARGGADAIDNLRLLCVHHNRLEAERTLGPGVSDQRRPLQ